MLASRCRKLRQLPGASPTVHTVHCHAEPKRSTPFTYLQVHVQVVHFVPFQGVILPRQASIFFNGRVGLPELLWNAARLSAELYGPVDHAPAFNLSLFSALVVPWEKLNPPYIPSTRPQIAVALLSFQTTLRLLCSSGSHNGKSQGYSFRQKYCQPESFLRQTVRVYPPLAVR